MSKRMQYDGKMFKCAIHAATEGSKDFHMDDCAGQLVTRQSVFGAVTRACVKGWSGIELEGWPTILRVEEA
jgi:hypothetical protein